MLVMIEAIGVVAVVVGMSVLGQLLPVGAVLKYFFHDETRRKRGME